MEEIDSWSVSRQLPVDRAPVAPPSERTSGEYTCSSAFWMTMPSPNVVSSGVSGPLQLLFAFEAVVIGGLGSLWGTLTGGIVLGVAQTIGATFDPQYSILAGHLVFLAILASPRGRSILTRSDR